MKATLTSDLSNDSLLELLEETASVSFVLHTITDLNIHTITYLNILSIETDLS